MKTLTKDIHTGLLSQEPAEQDIAIMSRTFASRSSGRFSPFFSNCRTVLLYGIHPGSGE